MLHSVDFTVETMLWKSSSYTPQYRRNIQYRKSGVAAQTSRKCRQLSARQSESARWFMAEAAVMGAEYLFSSNMLSDVVDAKWKEHIFSDQKLNIGH
jgi:hypothetical protein